MTPPSNRKMRRSREVAAASSAAVSSSSNSSNMSTSSGRNNNNNNSNASSSNDYAMDTTEDTVSVTTGLELYQQQGDSVSALQAYAAARRKGTTSSSSNNNLSSQYNYLLLSHIVPPSTNASSASPKEGNNDYQSPSQLLLQQLEAVEREMELKYKDSATSGFVMGRKRRKRNQWILAYNRALIYHAAGHSMTCLNVCCGSSSSSSSCKLTEFIESQQKPPADDQVIFVASRMACLMLECILTLSIGSSGGTGFSGGVEAATTVADVPTVNKIVAWLEMLDTDKDPQLKFLLLLYKSRLNLAAKDETGKHVDSKLRSARKELKSAMEVFQHKLRSAAVLGVSVAAAVGSGTDAGSVVSSANSEENSQPLQPLQQQQHQLLQQSMQPQSQATELYQQQPKSTSIVLQKHNQAALNLKANLEQLKGNAKKSLILCSEALQAVTTTTTDAKTYEAIHSNNLALVYESTGKRHLALHALAKGLQVQRQPQEQPVTMAAICFDADGTARPNPTILLLYNAAICALQAHNYASAYECMACCIAQSMHLAQHQPACWLRLAEACIGIFHGLQQQQQQQNQQQQQQQSSAPSETTDNPSQPMSSNIFYSIEVNGELKGILLDHRLCTDRCEVVKEMLVDEIGSPADVAQVKRNPLLRARACLGQALKQSALLSHDAVVYARLTLSYVCLHFREYEASLEMAQLVLQSSSSEQLAANVTDALSRRVQKRRVATARLYAAEAACALGDTVSAIQHLVGDTATSSSNGMNEALDRLASDLAGVTIETAACNGKGKRRLARAQTIVRSSASAVQAALGNVTTAKQLAMSAQAMEDAYSNNRERSSARRALIFGLMRGGNPAAALTLLRAMRMN